MHTYRRMPQGNGNYLYTVVFDRSTPDYSDFDTIKDFSNEKDAAAYVSYLNGGEHPRKPFPAEVV